MLALRIMLGKTTVSTHGAAPRLSLLHLGVVTGAAVALVVAGIVHSRRRRRAPPPVKLRRLHGSLGVEVIGLSAAAISALSADSPVVRQLADALEQHLLVLLHGDSQSPSLSPAQLRQLYGSIHEARFPGVRVDRPTERRPTACSANLRGRCFPHHPETSVLGFAESVHDWHGLSGWLEPSAWWGRQGGQFHHDGGFAAHAPPPPALVMMYCEEAPSRGGETLFLSTRQAMASAPTELAERARRMRCCYTVGFGAVRFGSYPIMSATRLTPTSPPRSDRAAAQEAREEEGEGEEEEEGGDSRSYRSITEFESFETLAFGATARGSGPCVHDPGSREAHDVSHRPEACYCHRLVQCDGRGRQYAVCHSVCLDRLEEWDGRSGAWRPWSWANSQAFLEALLSTAVHPDRLLAIRWAPGDVALWDNLQTQHSVTPTDVYATVAGTRAGSRRLMTRTAMQPLRDVLV